jgi:cardiolipin synthase A/B
VGEYEMSVIVAVFAVVELGGVILAVDAVMRPRSSQAAIAWSVSLLSLPIVVIPLYFIFGRTRFQGYAEALREKESHIEETLANWYSQMATVASKNIEELDAVEKLVQGVTSIPFTTGNRVDLLINADRTYTEMLAAIADAASYVLVQFYIIKDGVIGQRLIQALIDKARVGVKVYFLYDEIGCWQLSSAFLEKLVSESVQVSGFKTTQGRRNRFQINFRNHRKLLVVDGRIGFIGGHNLADEYLHYRDTHLRIEGPATQQIQLSFMKDWFWATRQILEVNKVIERHSSDAQSVAIVNTGPADCKAACSALFATMIHSAKHRLWLTSPYFVPDDVTVRALEAAAIRGVDVRLLLPGKADHLFVELASYTYYAQLIRCGVKIFRYQVKFLHQKVVLVDWILSGIGTVNLDNRSLYLNFEATALIADKGFAAQVETMLQADFEGSEPVRQDHLHTKPFYLQVAARVARLASPLL